VSYSNVLGAKFSAILPSATPSAKSQNSNAKPSATSQHVNGTVSDPQTVLLLNASYTARNHHVFLI